MTDAYGSEAERSVVSEVERRVAYALAASRSFSDEELGAVVDGSASDAERDRMSAPLPDVGFAARMNADPEAER